MVGILASATLKFETWMVGSRRSCRISLKAHLTGVEELGFESFVNECVLMVLTVLVFC